MERRERRAAKRPQRLGAFAADEELEEFDVEVEEQEEEAAAEAREAVTKAARTGRGRRAAPPPPACTADTLSGLLAGAPRLVELLLEEDSVRSITLVCRDVVNLSLAAGGRVELAPVWDALASKIRANGAEQQMQQQQQQQQGQGEAPVLGDVTNVAGAAASGAGAAAEPEPEAGVRTRRGGGGRRGKKAQQAPAPPPPPPALDIIREAVATDPARQLQVKKTESQWTFRLQPRDIAGIPTVKGRWGAQMMSQLEVRAAAHRRWGSEAALKAAQERAAEKARVMQEAREERAAEEKRQRIEQTELRLVEIGLAADAWKTASNTNRDFNNLRYWVDSGYDYWGGLEQLLAPIITQHQARLAREEAERQRQELQQRLDDSLAAEGLTAFKKQPEYTEFVRAGKAEELEALLEVARQQRDEQLAHAERMRELAERLEASGLDWWPHWTSPMFSEWLSTGEGDIEGIVQERRLRVDREIQLQQLLEENGLLHRQNAERCTKFVRGELLHGTGVPYTAEEVVDSLLASMADEYKRVEALMCRLAEERLPPVLHLPACREFCKHGGSLDAVVYQVHGTVYEQARVGAPPAGPRVWLSEERAAAGEAAGEEGAPEGAAQAEEVVPMDAQVVEMGMEAVAQGQE